MSYIHSQVLTLTYELYDCLSSLLRHQTLRTDSNYWKLCVWDRILWSLSTRLPLKKLHSHGFTMPTHTACSHMLGEAQLWGSLAWCGDLEQEVANCLLSSSLTSPDLRRTQRILDIRLPASLKAWFSQMKRIGIPAWGAGLSCLWCLLFETKLGLLLGMIKKRQKSDRWHLPND